MVEAFSFIGYKFSYTISPRGGSKLEWNKVIKSLSL